MKIRLLVLLALAWVPFSTAKLWSETLDIGSKRELFVDHYLIDQLNGVELVLCEPKDEGVVFAFDKPWEGQYSGYAVVLKVADDDY